MVVQAAGNEMFLQMLNVADKPARASALAVVHALVSHTLGVEAALIV